MIDELQSGRHSYSRRAWNSAWESLSLADAAQPLAADDLELLATCAYMLGRDEDFVRALERAYRAWVDAEATLRAARCAFWIGMTLILRGELGQATGWLARAQRLVDRDAGDCPERGYLLLPVMFEQAAAGDVEAAIETATTAAAIGDRLRDPDLSALAAVDGGQLLIQNGRVGDGLRQLDEAMLTLSAGELSPMVNGFIYCGVISGCQAAYEPRRAQEWTAALTRWCDEQPDMVSFTGTCRVHRAEIMQLHGAWPEALAEARQAQDRCAAAANAATAAEARYRQGEVHRLCGAFADAESAYRDAAQAGREPQPGLALLRLAQGRDEAAAAAIRRLVAETAEPFRRAGLLPAYVEVMLAAGDHDSARAGCHELDQIAAGWPGGMVGAMAASARGAVDLAAGDARGALVALRAAAQEWRAVDAPYETARTRVLIGLACRALGDEDSATLELEAARDAFAHLGAVPDRDHVDGLLGGDPHGLTPRELEVLRLLASGMSNREIAAALVISEHTVARHVQNLFAKLGVSSRTAASAFAYAHHLA